MVKFTSWAKNKTDESINYQIKSISCKRKRKKNNYNQEAIINSSKYSQD